MKPGPLMRAALGIALGVVAHAAYGATPLSEAGCERLASLEWAPVEGDVNDPANWHKR